MSQIPLPWALALTLLFLAVNGFFVAAEFALVKARRTRIAVAASNGSKQAKMAEHILDHLNLYLSGCQLGITVASLVLGWLAEPAVARLLIMGVHALGWSVSHGVLHGVAVAVALTAVTMLHMVFGEQAPKIWAIHTADSTTKSISYPLWVFVAALRPLIWLINLLSNLVLRMIGIKTGIGEETTHDVTEIRAIVARSAEEGYLTVRQGQFAKNILCLVDLEVRHILVPRVDVVVLSLESTLEENLRIVRESGHSRFVLVRDKGLDSAVGIVHAKDVLGAFVEQKVPDLDHLKRPVTFVPESQPVSRMIVEFQSSQSGCAIVVDERGTAVGLAFLDDALEEIVGPIADEFDQGKETGFENPERGIFLVPGAMPLPEARELLEIEELHGADTLGGYVVTLLKRLPRVGDSVTIQKYEVTVEGVSRHRVTQLRLEERKTGEEPPPEENEE